MRVKGPELSELFSKWRRLEDSNHIRNGLASPGTVEHLYNVNIMEMPGGAKNLEWLLFIGWQFCRFIDNTFHNNKTHFITPLSLYMRRWVLDQWSVRAPSVLELWWYWVITIITRGLHQLASALSEAGPSHAWRDTVTQPRDVSGVSHGSHLYTRWLSRSTFRGNVFIMETNAQQQITELFDGWMEVCSTLRRVDVNPGFCVPKWLG